MPQSNFDFMQPYPTLFTLAMNAERYALGDPNTSLIKSRQFAELVAKTVASHYQLEAGQLSQHELLKKFRFELAFEQDILNLFHVIRKQGNDATHQYESTPKEAVKTLLAVWNLALWFYRSFVEGMDNFEPTPFNPDFLADLSKERVNEPQEEKLIEEYQAKLTALEQKLAQQNTQETQQYQRELTHRLRQNSRKQNLDEQQTRLLIIDEQLRKAGWEVDSENLTYAKGTRPEKGKNLAIAEYPLPNGDRADYLLFCGLVPIAVVEAKKHNINVAGKIAQAERYARSFEQAKEHLAAWQVAGRTVAWSADIAANDGFHYQIPFVYSCNGRPFHKQIIEKSGTWFRDVRKQSNIKRALSDFHTPQVLLEMLKKDEEQAETKLSQEPFDQLGLYEFQVRAVKAVESALAAGKRDILIAMATGTGKTRTITGLIARLLKADRFRRILFLVDRSALASQVDDTFAEMKIEQGQTLHNLYNFAENGIVEPETKIKVATVQSMVKQIYYSDTPPTIDEFDCIIVDEAHRGYTLDQEMTDGEIEFRDNEQYLSTYRRVLDYFDAVKIGLTATPALHTTEIFGDPVFVYSYKEAVIDDYLVDHEPPLEIKTQLNEDGIHYQTGEVVEFIDEEGEVLATNAPDELNFEVESFNRGVINENFDRTVCEVLTKYISPFDEEKTLIFCVDDSHADRIERILDDLFLVKYGDDYSQAAVQKITGKADKPSERIKRYKNERYPNIAITVDLLSTGVDVPEICNLVFLRRVKSRILYEQMKGRATRKCDKIDKTTFRIFDAVGLCRSMQAVDTMKPIVKNPHISLEQLINEFNQLVEKSDEKAEIHKQQLCEQISQKVQQLLRKAEKKAQKDTALSQLLDECYSLWGKPENLPKLLLNPENATEFFGRNRQFAQEIAVIASYLTGSRMQVFSQHTDCVREVAPIYGEGESAEDYLQHFVEFIQSKRNENLALKAIINRPRDLTREQLKQIALELNQQGFNEVALNRALNQQTNSQIAAGIIAHIRRAALGDSLIPFEQRVDHALQKIYATHHWTGVQKKWLERIAKQLKENRDEIIDRHRLSAVFGNSFGIIKREFGDELDNIIGELNEGLWEVQG